MTVKKSAVKKKINIKAKPKANTSKAKQVYTCETCGVITTEKGHLCAPMRLDKMFSCEFCNSLFDDPRHVCKPKVINVTYFCDACGRMAVKKTELCVPKKIK